MPDTTDRRTKRQKIQELRDKATTDGERAAAQAALDRLGPEPGQKLHWRPKTDGSARAGQKSATRTAWQRIIDEMNQWQFDDWQYRTPQWEETRRQFEAEETLRRAGFTMPKDPGFEASFAAEAARAQQTFRRASEDVSRAQRRDPLDVGDTERLMRDYLEGRATINDLRRHMGMEDT